MNNNLTPPAKTIDHLRKLRNSSALSDKEILQRAEHTMNELGYDEEISKKTAENFLRSKKEKIQS